MKKMQQLQHSCTRNHNIITTIQKVLLLWSQPNYRIVKVDTRDECTTKNGPICKEAVLATNIAHGISHRAFFVKKVPWYTFMASEI